MRRLIILAEVALGLLFASCTKEEQRTLSVIPAPLKVELQQEVFSLNSETGLYIDASEGDKKILEDYLVASSMNLKPVIAEEGHNVVLKQVAELPEVNSSEGYVLTVTPDQVLIRATSGAGLFYGVQTMLQMVDEKGLPAGVITDEPRFAYRGFMMDVSRHFFDKEFIKKQMDALAYYKLNRLHLHLTDAAGWRLEIKKYPRLTEFAAWREFPTWKEWWNNGRRYEEEGSKDAHGGYYTQDDIRELVAYAQERFITVIPEIDMPGHMLAAVSNYEGVSCFNETGWGSVFSSPVCPGKDSALEFCKNVYAELIALFPYKYVHIGGDEVEKTNWKKCPDCQKRMHDNNLKTEEELQSWFIHDMERFFNGKGKEMIGWDEIIEGGLSKTATVMWWRSWVKDAATKATAQGNPVIFTPNGQFYLDYAEDKNSMASIYNLDTTDNLTPEQQSLILGVQGNIWCEWIPSNARMQYMTIPRLLAIAELGWSKPEQKDWNAFKQRLSDQFERLNIMGINYRIPDLEGFNAVNAFIGEGTINVTCLDPTAEIHYTTDGSTPTLQSPVYEGPIKVTETTDFTFCTFRPNGKKGDIAKTRFIKSEYTPSVTAAPSNPGLKATWHEFKGNKCSEIEKAPINGTYPVEDVMIPKKVKGNIGLIIKGYFNAPQDDIYTFALLSDDGSTLTIDSEQIVDNDGPHGPKEIVGQKALAKGYHPMELRYFDQNGGQLKLKVTGSDGKEIPFTHLYAH